MTKETYRKKTLLGFYNFRDCINDHHDGKPSIRLAGMVLEKELKVYIQSMIHGRREGTNCYSSGLFDNSKPGEEQALNLALLGSLSFKTSQ